MASSPRGDITGSTYTDLGATTPEALAISTRSREFARQEIGNETLEDRVRQRCAIAVGDIGHGGAAPLPPRPGGSGPRRPQGRRADRRRHPDGRGRTPEAGSRLARPLHARLWRGTRGGRRDHPDLGRTSRPRRPARGRDHRDRERALGPACALRSDRGRVSARPDGRDPGRVRERGRVQGPAPDPRHPVRSRTREPEAVRPWRSRP